MGLAIDIGFILLGLVLIVFARQFSLRYNAWTTRLRERHPGFNPPPTPQWRARNTMIMTALFRIFGIALLIIHLPLVLKLIKR